MILLTNKTKNLQKLPLSSSKALAVLCGMSLNRFYKIYLDLTVYIWMCVICTAMRRCICTCMCTCVYMRTYVNVKCCAWLLSTLYMEPELCAELTVTFPASLAFQLLQGLKI